MNKQEKLICLSICNKSLFVQKFRPLFIAVSQATAMQTRQELKVEGKQIMAAEKMQQKPHRVYPPEIIQTNSLGRLQKKLLKYNDCLYAASIYIITIKIVTHRFAAETVTCICAAETSTCITATETATCIIVTERSTNIPVTESNT